jgi:hypothetical protein
MFYDLIPADIIQNFSQPFRYSYTYNTPFSLADPLRGQVPLLLTTNITNPQFIGLQSATYPDPGMRMPYVEQVNLSVQREIVRDTVLEVAYVGKFGHKLLYGNESNPAVYRPGETLSNLNNYRIIPGWGSLAVMQTSANSSCTSGARAGDIQCETHRLAVVDCGPSTAKRAAGGAVISGGWLAVERAVHRAHGTCAESDDGVRRGAERDRQPEAERGGKPKRAERPDAVGGACAMVQSSGVRRTRHGHFRKRRARHHHGARYGCRQRRVVQEFSVALAKVMKVQFPAEFFNVLNRVNLGNPNVTLGSSMGRITSAGSARVLQFALKLLF